MARPGKCDHLKPVVLRMMETGFSCGEITSQYPSLPKSTVYEWKKSVAQNRQLLPFLRKSSGGDSVARPGQFDDIKPDVMRLIAENVQWGEIRQQYPDLPERTLANWVKVVRNDANPELWTRRPRSTVLQFPKEDRSPQPEEKKAELQLVENLPSVGLDELRLLPNYPGVYFAVSSIDGKTSVLYVGEAKNLKARWEDHHRTSELRLLVSVGLKVRIHFLIIPGAAGSKKNLLDLEAHYIKVLSPSLNQKPVTKIDRTPQMCLF